MPPKETDLAAEPQDDQAAVAVSADLNLPSRGIVDMHGDSPNFLSATSGVRDAGSV